MTDFSPGVSATTSTVSRSRSNRERRSGESRLRRVSSAAYLEVNRRASAILQSSRSPGFSR